MNEQIKIRNGRNLSEAKNRQSPLLSLCDSAPDEALKQLDASRSGLTPEQVEERLEKYGPNEVTHEKPPVWYVQLSHAFVTPFNGVLFAVSIVSLFTDVIFARQSCRFRNDCVCPDGTAGLHEHRLFLSFIPAGMITVFS